MVKKKRRREKIHKNGKKKGKWSKKRKFEKYKKKW